jgi:hypothetical protein
MSATFHFSCTLRSMWPRSFGDSNAAGSLSGGYRHHASPAKQHGYRVDVDELHSTSFIALVPALAVTLGATVCTTPIVRILTFDIAAATPRRARAILPILLSNSKLMMLSLTASMRTVTSALLAHRNPSDCGAVPSSLSCRPGCTECRFGLGVHGRPPPRHRKAIEWDLLLAHEAGFQGTAYE